MGEPSGDALAAEVVEALGVQAFGVVGPRCRSVGVEALADIGGLAAIGLLDGLRAAPRALDRIRRIEAAARARRPRLLLTVDAPSFTLRASARVRRLGVPAVHLVCPQVWAWRASRVRRLASQTDVVLCLHAFEAEALAGHVRAVVVGDLTARPPLGRGEPDEVALLPGSRPAEIARHAPVLREVARRLVRVRPGTRFVTVRAPGAPPLTGIDVETRASVQHLAGIGGAVVAAGTATAELAALGVPQVVIYRTDPLTWQVARRLLTVEHIALPNLRARARVVPEHVQRLDPDAIVADLLLEMARPREAPRADRAAALQAVVDEMRRWLRA